MLKPNFPQNIYSRTALAKKKKKKENRVDAPFSSPLNFGMIFYFIKYLHLMLYLSTSSPASIAHTPLHQHTNMKLISEFEMRISKFILWSRSSCSFDNWPWHSLRGSYWGVNPHLLKIPKRLTLVLLIMPAGSLPLKWDTSFHITANCCSMWFKKIVVHIFSPTEALIRRIKFWCTSTAYICSRSFFLSFHLL